MLQHSVVCTLHCTLHHTPQYCTVQWCTVPSPLLSSQLQRKNVDTSIPPHTSLLPSPGHSQTAPPFKHFYLHYRLRHRALTVTSRAWADLCSEMSFFLISPAWTHLYFIMLPHSSSSTTRKDFITLQAFLLMDHN